MQDAGQDFMSKKIFLSQKIKFCSYRKIKVLLLLLNKLGVFVCFVRTHARPSNRELQSQKLGREINSAPSESRAFTLYRCTKMCWFYLVRAGFFVLLNLLNRFGARQETERIMAVVSVINNHTPIWMRSVFC